MSAVAQEAVDIKTGLEQHVEPRWILQSSVSVFLQDSKECLGLMVNCSKNGLMISSYQPLQVGSVLNVDIVDIHPDMDGRRTGHCQIEIIWQQTLNPCMYANGCRVISSSSEYIKMLHQYIETNQRQGTH